MDVELARQHWLDGTRRVDGARGDRRRHALLQGGVDVVVDGLRQRIGQTFTLAELAAAYDGADDWVRELLDEHHPEGGVPVEPGTVADAAFHAYARGALDYKP
jgi:hypothetical protein